MTQLLRGSRRVAIIEESRMQEFVHIDISADDPQRAVDFYAKVFGWHAQKWRGRCPTD
jgi:predicted enzyme related to lactoylglutathione lyase